MELKDIRVFVCVPGVGKTHLSTIDDRFVDLDNEKAMYKYGYSPDIPLKEFESYKGNRDKSKARKDSNEYMKHRFEYYLNETDKVLLFAPNPEMVEMIYNSKTPYCLVYHSKSCVEEIRQRMRNRGNTESFINSMLDPIDYFYSNSVNDTRPSFKIELFEGEYLSDKLLPLFANKPELKLILPSKDYKEQIKNFKKEMIDAGSSMDGTGNLKSLDFDAWLKETFDHKEGKNLPLEFVPATQYLCIRISDNKLIGMVQIRHKLNNFLLNFGGHIGDCVAINERNKGYGKQILALALEKCKQHGINKVLLTCKDTNTPSKNVLFTMVANMKILEQFLVRT